MSTPFNKEIALPNYKMIMKNATYSNENGILEVNFSIEKTSVTFSGELLLEAKERNNPTKKLDVNMINLNGKDYTVIVKLPKEWTTIYCYLQKIMNQKQVQSSMWIEGKV